ncbi:MAG TPA: Ig-like domain-containing protein [Gemmatimonadaceae bacterium]
MVKVISRARRWTRTVQILSAAMLAASCSDRLTVDEIAPGHARLSLAPRFAVIPGAPTVQLSRIDGSLTSPAGDSTFQKSNFVAGSASLIFDVQLTGASEEFVLDLVGYDANGNEAYRAHQVYSIKPGINDDLAQPVLEYSAPDAKVVSLAFSPGDTTLSAGGAMRIGVRGFTATESQISSVRVGWTSRNPAVATVDDSGSVVALQVKGQTYIVARTPANIADSILVTTRGAVATVVPTPTSISIFRGATANLSAEVRDPSGAVISDRPPTFATANASIATVSAAGVVTGVAVGSTTITATSDGKSATVPVTVATPVAGLQLAPPTLILTAPGATSLLSYTIAAVQGASTAGLVPAFKTSDATIATVGTDGRVTAVDYGTATITASIDGFSATTAVSVVSGLTLAPATAEKLPNGTQQYTVTAGGKGPFTWTVNGISGGNATFGTITAAGFYTAPATVPTPSSFNICATQASPSSAGCAQMTINPVPSAGADVIVFNDMNLWDNTNGFFYGGANQGRLVTNLISFTGTGARASKLGFMFYRGHGSQCATSECAPANISQMTDTLKSHGYSIIDNSDATLTGPIDPSVKVFLILVPTTAFSVAEVNILKQFAGEGGRIVFSGENGGYYGSSIDPVENVFFTQMGAQLRNSVTQVNCTGGTQWVVPATSLRPHQVTTGLTGVSIPCASGIVPGPNDYALIYDYLGTSVVAAVAKIDLTPLTDQPLEVRALKAKLNRAPTSSSAPRTTGTGKPLPPN